MTRLQREWSGPETPVHRRRPARQHALWILIAWLLTCIALTTPSYGQVATLTPLRVVVLGDSYSAGNGAGHYYGVHGCFRSHEAWAEKYVDWLTISNREQSVIEDLRRIRGHPLIPARTPIYCYSYDVRTGQLIEVSEATEAGRPS